ncbi:MAG: FtsW/RodA/SpoVE family cell cycle protein [Gemmatimonadota bacterium]
MKDRLRGGLGDPLLFWLVLVLSLIGVAMVYSAGQLDVPDPAVEGLWLKQLVFLAVSLLAMLFVMRVETRWFEWAAVPLYVIGTLSLAATLVIGTGKG